MVEFAVILPVLLVLLLALVQFALVFDAYLSLEESARIGVRAWATGEATTQAAVRAVVDQASPSLAAGAVGAVVLGCPQYAGGECPGSGVAEPQGTLLEVTVAYTEPIVVPPFDALFGATLPLRASVVMESEAP